MGRGGRPGGGFRRQPPDVANAEVVARPTLMAALSERFDHRVTLMTAVAGAGKTTTLALALEANTMQPRGIDIWVAADARDAESGALMSSIAQALSAPLGADDVAAIADAVWTRAPDDVAIFIDDAHHLIGSPAEAELADLLRQLPRNGHLVVAGRRCPDLPLARLRAHDEICEISNDELLLTDGELDALIDRHHDAPDPHDALSGSGSGSDERHQAAREQLPRLAGLADITLRFGQAASADFVWQEMLMSMGSGELDVLKVLALFGEFDNDVIVEVATHLAVAIEDPGEWLASLPLVDQTPGGTVRFHALLRSALLVGVSADDLRALRVQASQHALTLGYRALAVELLADAGETMLASDAARSFLLGSSLRRTFDQLRSVRDAVAQVSPESALVQLLDAELCLGPLSRDMSHDSIVSRFETAAELAQSSGDEEVEAAALYRANQASVQHGGRFDPAKVERLAVLAETVPYAAQVVRYGRAILALGRGGADAALAEVTPLDDPWDPISEQVFRAGLLCQLGRFEAVDDLLRADSSEAVAPAATTYHEYAIYFRGEVLPEVALTLHDETSFGISASRIVSPVVVTCGVRALMAAHADDAEAAERAISVAEHAATWGSAASVLAYIDASRAAAAMVFDGEAAALAVVTKMLDAVPIRGWPTPAHLQVVELLYLLVPETRPLLERCDFGPAQRVAVDAAKAVLDIRATGHSSVLAELPWTDHGLMRVQVSPPLLVELAAVAAADGLDAAHDLVATVPGAERHLRRVVAEATNASSAAAALLADWPQPPLDAIRVCVLGPLVVTRNGEIVRHPDFDRRVRVQELLALLLEFRRLQRPRVSALLWPDLDRKKASGNLRVTLAYLNRALEPNRSSDDETVCVRAEGDDLVLHASVTTDLDDFDRLIRRATAHDRSGAPRAALESYRSALQLWSGEYAEQIEAEWAEPTRERVRFAAVNAMLRLGELTLARGEPEEALEWAVRARVLAPVHDRIERLNASCRRATGDRTGAVRTLRTLGDDLAEMGLAPEPETQRLLARLLDTRGGERAESSPRNDVAST